MRRFTILLFMILVLAMPAGATIYHVTTTGVNDAGRTGLDSGSNAWLGIQYALTRICSYDSPCDDTIYVHEGTYLDEPSTGYYSPYGEYDGYLYIMGAAGENKPVLAGQNTCCFRAAHSEEPPPRNYVLKNLIYSKATPNINAHNINMYSLDGTILYIHNVVIEGCEFYNEKKNACCLKFAGVDSIIVRDCQFSSADSSVLGLAAVGGFNFEVYDCTFEHLRQCGVEFKGGSSYVRIHNNIFHEVGTTAVNYGGGTSLEYVRPDTSDMDHPLFECREMDVWSNIIINSPWPYDMDSARDSRFFNNLCIQTDSTVVFLEGSGSNPDDVVLFETAATTYLRHTSDWCPNPCMNDSIVNNIFYFNTFRGSYPNFLFQYPHTHTGGEYDDDDLYASTILVARNLFYNYEDSTASWRNWDDDDAQYPPDTCGLDAYGIIGSCKVNLYGSDPDLEYDGELEVYLPTDTILLAGDNWGVPITPPDGYAFLDFMGDTMPSPPPIGPLSFGFSPEYPEEPEDEPDTLEAETRVRPHTLLVVWCDIDPADEGIYGADNYTNVTNWLFSKYVDALGLNIGTVPATDTALVELKANSGYYDGMVYLNLPLFDADMDSEAELLAAGCGKLGAYLQKDDTLIDIPILLPVPLFANNVIDSNTVFHDAGVTIIKSDDLLEYYNMTTNSNGDSLFLSTHADETNSPEVYLNIADNPHVTPFMWRKYYVDELIPTHWWQYEKDSGAKVYIINRTTASFNGGSWITTLSMMTRTQPVELCLAIDNYGISPTDSSGMGRNVRNALRYVVNNDLKLDIFVDEPQHDLQIAAGYTFTDIIDNNLEHFNVCPATYHATSASGYDWLGARAATVDRAVNIPGALTRISADPVLAGITDITSVAPYLGITGAHTTSDTYWGQQALDDLHTYGLRNIYSYSNAHAFLYPAAVRAGYPRYSYRYVYPASMRFWIDDDEMNMYLMNAEDMYDESDSLGYISIPMLENNLSWYGTGLWMHPCAGEGNLGYTIGNGASIASTAIPDWQRRIALHSQYSPGLVISNEAFDYAGSGHGAADSTGGYFEGSQSNVEYSVGLIKRYMDFYNNIAAEYSPTGLVPFVNTFVNEVKHSRKTGASFANSHVTVYDSIEPAMPPGGDGGGNDTITVDFTDYDETWCGDLIVCATWTTSELTSTVVRVKKVGGSWIESQELMFEDTEHTRQLPIKIQLGYQYEWQPGGQINDVYYWGEVQGFEIIEPWDIEPYEVGE